MIKVDPAVINEVRGLGRIVMRTTADPIYAQTVQVVEILVLDVGASDFTKALSVARGRLQQRGWSVSSYTDVTVIMTSSRWSGTTAVLSRVDDIDSLGAQLEPGMEKAFQADPVKSGTYIVLSLSSIEG
ncbi:hypothetical protein [Nonomuraea sp. NEAU-A123]|uniref:hypothetical protein n=1 Tax=Nonomuraea sp. NEAU-A123 TaxID=2839649 RepID=UPI001BE4992C|nr:hypothetical protein [Nonomuraea sp. NEAU-A123]MBT2233907.1 hypothetical protein [Nonomuraea sp. NEAU-A123]